MCWGMLLHGNTPLCSLVICLISTYIRAGASLSEHPVWVVRAGNGHEQLLCLHGPGFSILIQKRPQNC
jgi:hypothetical protein